MENPSRRAFLRSAGAGGLALGLAGKLRAAGPNEKVVVGLIGCGQRGRRFFDHVDFVCDPDGHRLANAAQKSGLSAKHAVSDLRRVLDNRDIDAVVIATPDHWHAPAAILALEAGKDVYVEKPWSHNFRESQLLHATAQRHGRVVQHGTQSRSLPFARDAMGRLREGVIGDVLVAKAWNVQRRPGIGRAAPSAPPAGVDYDLWVGPAEMVPFQSNRFHYDWHWWYNFGTGDIGNDGTHEIDLARWGLGVDTLPSQVAAVGGKYFHDDDQQFPDTATCVFEYPGQESSGRPRQLVFEMRLWSTNYPENCDGGVEFYGTKGKMLFSKRGKLEIRGPRNEVIQEERRDVSWEAEHLKDFTRAIRESRRPSADIDEAHRSVALVHLANIAIKAGRSFNFDPDAQQVIGDNEINGLLGRSYREGGHWAVPQGVTAT